jgi:hypothetical protein
MFTNNSAQLQSRSAAAIDRLMSSANQAVPQVLAAVTRYLGNAAERVRVEVAAAAKNSIDGSVTFLLKASTVNGELEWEMPVALERGVPVLTEAKVLEEFAKASGVAAKRVVDMGETEVAAMPIDFRKVVAGRVGDLIIYSSPELPRWNLPVSAADLKTEEGRTAVLAELKQAINFYTLSDFGVSAKLVGDVKLPIVAATTVRAAARPTALPELNITAEQALIQEPDAVYGARIQKPAQSFSKVELRASEYRHGFEARVRRIAEPVLRAWAQAQGGGAIEVISWNLDAAEDSGVGTGKGRIVATVRYYTDTAREEVEVSAAFTSAGELDPQSITKTEQQVKFEASRTAEFAIKSEAEAKEELAKFTAQKEQEALIQAFIHANLGLEAAGEQAQNDQNFGSGPAPKRIPLLKALLPKGAQEAGKKIELAGWVYVLAETEYNNISGDPEHGAYLMACLTDELPGKYPSMGMFGSLGSAFALGR